MRSTRSVRVPAKLHTVDQNDSVVVEDLVDDAIVAAPRRPKTLKFPNERFAAPVRILSNRPEDRLQCSVAHLLGELVVMTETLSRDLDLVHAATSHVVLETQPLARLTVAARTSKRLHEIVVLEDVQGFFEGLEVVGTQ